MARAKVVAEVAGTTGATTGAMITIDVTVGTTEGIVTMIAGGMIDVPAPGVGTTGEAEAVHLVGRGQGAAIDPLSDVIIRYRSSLRNSAA